VISFMLSIERSGFFFIFIVHFFRLINPITNKAITITVG